MITGCVDCRLSGVLVKTAGQKRNSVIRYLPKAEFSTSLTGRKNTLFPFSSAATGKINIRVNDRYQYCHDYIIKDADLALPLKEAHSLMVSNVYMKYRSSLRTGMGSISAHYWRIRVI
jgi:hypothetical protein